MPPKTNPMIQKIEAKYEAYYQNLFQAKIDMAMQVVQDAACFAAHDMFKMGPGRAIDFCASIRDYTNEMMKLMKNDLTDDQDYEYTKAKIDEALKRIVGEQNFTPWESRYSR